MPFFGFVVIAPAGVITSLGSAISIKNLPTNTAIKTFSSFLANFSPIQLLGPCKKVKIL
jgi:hypothetical protein